MNELLQKLTELLENEQSNFHYLQDYKLETLRRKRKLFSSIEDSEIKEINKSIEESKEILESIKREIIDLIRDQDTISTEVKKYKTSFDFDNIFNKNNQ